MADESTVTSEAPMPDETTMSPTELAVEEQAQSEKERAAHQAEVTAQAAQEAATTKAYETQQQSANPALFITQMLKEGASLDQAAMYAEQHGLDLTDVAPDSSLGKALLAKAGTISYPDALANAIASARETTPGVEVSEREMQANPTQYELDITARGYVRVGDKLITRGQANYLSGLSGGQQARVYESVGLIDTTPIRTQNPQLEQG